MYRAVKFSQKIGEEVFGLGISKLLVILPWCSLSSRCSTPGIWWAWQWSKILKKFFKEEEGFKQDPHN